MNKKTNKKLLNLIIEDEQEVKIKAELINETYQLLEIEFKNLKTKKKTKNNWPYKIIILCELLLTPLIFFYNKSLRSIAV